MANNELHVFEWPTCKAATRASLVADHRPMVFDLDGTLIRQDSATMLWTAAVSKIWQAWQHPPRLAGWGRHELAVTAKDWAVRVLPALEPALAPAVLNSNVVKFAQDAAALGRPLWLVSGTMQPVADFFANRLAEHANLSFAKVRGSQWPVNLISKHKAEWLSGAAPEGFDYVGDHLRHDRPIWARARSGFWVATQAASSAIAIKQHE